MKGRAFARIAAPIASAAMMVPVIDVLAPLSTLAALLAAAGSLALATLSLILWSR